MSPAEDAPLQEFAVEARYEAGPFPLPAERSVLLALAGGRTGTLRAGCGGARLIGQPAGAWGSALRSDAGWGFALKLLHRNRTQRGEIGCNH
jgi:hypothetical protein